MDAFEKYNEEYVATLQDTINRLKQELSEANAKAEENWDLALRNKAEEENVKKRARQDIENAHKYGIESFARSLFEVVDCLEQGIQAAHAIETSDPKLNNILHGMELTLKLILDAMAKFKISTIDPKGELFNPMQHEALSMQATEEAAPNTVLSVLQKGFTLYERVLRPARVVVAKSNSQSTIS